MMCTYSADGTEDDMRIFDFCKKEWSALKLAVTPHPVVRPFIDTYGSSLLQFGGGLHCLAHMLFMM